MDLPEDSRGRARSPIGIRLHGGWISDSDYINETSLFCTEVGLRLLSVYCLF